MTRDSPRAGDGHCHGPTGEPDLLGGLWEEMPFVRLPRDAPQELKELVEEAKKHREPETGREGKKRSSSAGAETSASKK